MNFVKKVLEMKDSKMKKLQLNRVLLTFMLLTLSVFKCFADDDLDPFIPDDTDPGNVEIAKYLPVLVFISLIYVFRKFYKKNLNTSSMTLKEDFKN